MKNILVHIGLMTVLATSSALASSKSFVCSGQAEYNKILIQKLVISEKEFNIDYSVSGVSFSQHYLTTEYLQKNGSTDANKTAYFMGATKSGQKKDYDDISLPHFGIYRNGGLGSEIAFNHNGDRVFGTVDCKEQE